MLRISQPPIISFVRLLGKLVIFRPLLEYCALTDRSPLQAVPSTAATARVLSSRIVDKTAGTKIRAAIPGQDLPCAIKFLTLRASFHLPRAAKFYSEYFLYL
jgi:hypothetical protein